MVRMGLIFDTDPALVLVDCCDIIPHCRRCLKAFQPGFKHVFCDMADRLPTGLRKELREVAPKPDGDPELFEDQLLAVDAVLESAVSDPLFGICCNGTTAYCIVLCTASSACCMVQATMTLRTAFLVSVGPERHVWTSLPLVHVEGCLGLAVLHGCCGCTSDECAENMWCLLRTGRCGRWLRRSVP